MRGTIGESRIAPADCLARKDVRLLCDMDMDMGM